MRFRILIVILFCIQFCSCEKKIEQDNSKEIRIQMSNDLIINNPKIMKIIDSFLSEYGNNPTIVYQLTIGNYEEGIASIYLDMASIRGQLSYFPPIGYFKYKGMTVLVYSALMDYCPADKKIIKMSEKLGDGLFDDLSHKPGESFPLSHHPTWKINILKTHNRENDSIWVEKHAKSPLLPHFFQLRRNNR